MFGLKTSKELQLLEKVPIRPQVYRQRGQPLTLTILKNDFKAADRSASPFVKFDLGSPYFETDLRSKNVNFAFPDKTPLNQPKSTQKLFDDKGYTETTSPSPAKPAEEIHFEKRHFSNMSPRATHVNRTHISPSKNASRVSINPSTPPDPYRSSERDIPNAKAATPAASRVKSSNEPSSFSPSLYATESLKDTTVGNPLSAFCLGIDATVGRINALLYELKEREQLVATDATVSVCENALSHLGNLVPSEGKDDEEEASTDTDSSSNSGDDDNSTVEGDSSFMMSNETELFTPSRLGSGGSWWELLQPVSRELSRFVLLHSVAATSPLPSLSPLPARRSGPITTISDDNLNLISSNFDNITQELTGMTTQAHMTQIGKALNECLSLLSTGVEHDWTVSEEDVANKKGEAVAAQMELAQYEQRAKNEMRSAQTRNHANNSASSRKAQFQTALRENHEAISQAERILHNSTKQLAVLFEQRKKLACDYVSNERKIASQTSESKQKDNRKTIERNLKGFQKKVRSALKAVASAEDDQRIASLLRENIYKPLVHAMHPNEVHEKNMWNGIDPRKSLNFDL